MTDKTENIFIKLIFKFALEKLLIYNFVFGKKMGSSPSYQGSEVFQREQPKINNRRGSNFKESNRIALNKPIEGELQENPEQQNVVNQLNPSQRASAKMKESKTRQIVIPSNQLIVQQTKPVPKVNYEEMAKSNIPKKMIQHSNSEEEEQQQRQTPKRKQIKQTNQQVRAKIHSTNRKPIDQEHFQPVYEKNHRKLLKQKQHGQQFNQIPFQNHDPSHKRNIVYRPHKNGEIDYHQYDSAHIRHKAIQQIHEIEHKKPIIQREPIYEHEKLYPKILKDHHQQPTNNKRGNSKTKQTQNDRRIAEQQKMEQLRKINLYRKHKMHLNGSSNDNYDDTQEPEPKSHPNFKKYHKEENDLQKSMEVRTGRKQYHQNLQQSMNVRERRQFDKIKTQRKGNIEQAQEIIEQNPSKANFLKKKTNKYYDQSKNEQSIKAIQAKNNQFQEKSIAQIKNQKDFDVSQYEVDPSQLKTCKECGRKFHQSRIKKHETICRRLAEEKREQFNAQDQRMISKQQKKFIKRGKLTEEKINQSKKKQKIPKWKAQSIALRAHIKMGKDSNYVPDSDQMEMMSQQHHIDVVNCQFCGRNFNKNAAKTHIPFCQSKYEKQLEKQRFQRHPKNKR